MRAVRGGDVARLGILFERYHLALLQYLARDPAAQTRHVFVDEFSAPLVLGGSMKVSYDGLLYRQFRHLKPPEEL